MNAAIDDQYQRNDQDPSDKNNGEQQQFIKYLEFEYFYNLKMNKLKKNVEQFEKLSALFTNILNAINFVYSVQLETF